jgi:hypothetical protein
MRCKSVAFLLIAIGIGTVASAQEDELAKRQAAATVALLKSGHADQVWPLLVQSTDNSRRSYLIEEIGWAHVPIDIVFSQLCQETDPSARRALVLALGAYDHGDVPPSTRRKYRCHTAASV